MVRWYGLLLFVWCVLFVAHANLVTLEKATSHQLPMGWTNERTAQADEEVELTFVLRSPGDAQLEVHTTPFASLFILLYLMR